MICKIRKAVIPVAGLGTRMLPATKAIPKEMLPIFDRPIIEFVVREAIAGGMTELILITRSGKEAIENHLDADLELEQQLEKNGDQKTLDSIKSVVPKNVKITLIRQRGALGLGHAVLCAKPAVNNEPFAVLLPDVLIKDQKKRKEHHSFLQMIKAWNSRGVGQVMVHRVSRELVGNYGIIEPENDELCPYKSESIRGLVEKPSKSNAPSDWAILGRYVLPSEVFGLLEHLDLGSDEEIQLTPALDKLCRQKGLDALAMDGEVFDCGDKAGLLCANIAFGMRYPRVRAAVRQLFLDNGW